MMQNYVTLLLYQTFKSGMNTSYYNKEGASQFLINKFGKRLIN